jgi:hypothetical protein
MMNLSITFVGLLQLLSLAAAYWLGRMTERPKSKWPKGSMFKGGWQAWQVPLIIMVAATAGLTMFLPVLAGSLRGLGLGRMLGGLGGYPQHGGGHGGGHGGYQQYQYNPYNQRY